jgi:hypothetical protein
MRKLLLTTTAMLSLSAGAAFADLSTEALVAMFPDASKIEISRGLLTTKVEAIVGDQQFEMIFDNATEEVIKSEVYTLSEEELADELNDDDDDEDEDDDDDEDEDEDEDDDDDDDDSDEDDHGDDHD